MKLTIDNSQCQITDFTPKQYAELRALMSYRVNSQQRYFSGGHTDVRYLLDKKGCFPTGLLYLFDTWIKTQRPSTLTVREDLRKKPLAVDKGLFKASLPITPRAEQIDAANACVAHSRGIVVAPTGTGKSVMIALIVEKLGVPTLIVVPSLELKRQLTESFREIFGNDKVGPRALIDIQNVDALDPAYVEKRDCVIIDEFHHSGAETYRKLNKRAWSKVYYKFGLTATPFRSQDSEKLLLESVLSEVIYRLDYRTAVDKGYIVPVEAYYFDLPKHPKAASFYTWHEVHRGLIVENEERNRLIAWLMGMLTTMDRSTLCLVKEIKHGKKLQTACNTDFVHGAEEDRSVVQRFSNGAIKRLIGTTGVVGEGVDTRAAEWIILACGGKSKNAFMQQVGRGLRRFGDKESCKVILFRDASNKYLLRHFQACVAYLKAEYGVIPAQLPYPEK